MYWEEPRKRVRTFLEARAEALRWDKDGAPEPVVTNPVQANREPDLAERVVSALSPRFDALESPSRLTASLPSRWYATMSAGFAPRRPEYRSAGGPYAPHQVDGQVGGND